MNEKKLMKQAEFARLLGYHKSTVTQLKQAGRLVMDGALVDVEASKVRIAQTAANRDDVASRWAEQRGTTAPGSDPDGEVPRRYQSAKASKEYYAAELARLQFERESGSLVSRSEVEAAISDVTTVFRQALENMPYRVSPEFVGQDLVRIRAIFKREVHQALKAIEAEFTTRLEAIGANDE